MPEIRGRRFERIREGSLGNCFPAFPCFPSVFFDVGTGITAAQLYSTASFQAGDLRDVNFVRNDLSGVNFSAQNLTNAEFTFATLNGANFAMADGVRLPI